METLVAAFANDDVLLIFGFATLVAFLGCLPGFRPDSRAWRQRSEAVHVTSGDRGGYICTTCISLVLLFANQEQREHDGFGHRQTMKGADREQKKSN